jgi:hypothetical protein
MSKFIKLTTPGGKNVYLDAEKTIKISRAVAVENGNGAQTKIVWSEELYVKEKPDEVAKQVSAFIEGGLARFSLPDGSPIWVNPASVDGPLLLADGVADDNIKSCILAGASRVYLGSTPQEVVDEIKAHNGEPYPLP